MTTMTLEKKIPKPAKVKAKSNVEKIAPVSMSLEFKISKYLGIITTRKGSRVKAFSTTNSKVNLVIFPLLPCGTPSKNSFLIRSTQLRAEVRRTLGY
ncbi:MAG: hypothetical protein KME35_23890 [Aphanocapsa sp. GSE-SYN-MK-11-07L]|nr:hypothetical protein [Aphanocapsa sp. GSE-SYN-MK-11-07L]